MLHDSSQGLWRNEAIAELDDVLDFAPVNRTAIKAHPKPSSRADVSRKVIALRVHACAIDVLSQC